MKITVDVSEENEGTDSPYWLILDPGQNMGCNVDMLAAQITGPFFSREKAQAHLKARRYAFTSRAVVYCNSGYWSHEYKEQWNAAREKERVGGNIAS